MKFPTYKFETQSFIEGYDHVIGCDEVGVAPIAGPVVAAACVLDPAGIGKYRSKSKWYYRVRDSKTTYEDERDDLAQEIKSHCVAWGIGEVAPEKIDQINIHHASLLAMKLAVENVLQTFSNKKIQLFLDGRFILNDLAIGNALNQGCVFRQKAVIDGDALVLSISAASIIAKVYRDDVLRRMDQEFPQYGFARHKGYNTKEHRNAVIENGVTKFHRKSFLKNFNFQQKAYAK